MKLTNKKIQDFSTNEYCKHRKEIRMFYGQDNLEKNIIVLSWKQNYLRFKNKYYKNFRQSNPKLKRFFRILSNIKQRCGNSNNLYYKTYGQREIGFLITVDDIIRLWFRDKAYKMKQPSIDRTDNDSHYIYKNCMFIELSENVKKSHVDRKNRKKVINYLNK